MLADIWKLLAEDTLWKEFVAELQKPSCSGQVAYYVQFVSKATKEDDLRDVAPHRKCWGVEIADSQTPGMRAAVGGLAPGLRVLLVPQRARSTNLWLPSVF